MKKKKTSEFKCFVLILAVLWIVSDAMLTWLDPLKYSDYIFKNDYELTQLRHPEKVWDKVFFGSSVVIASYLEEQSAAGYVNAGVDYGMVSDIYEMIKKGKINIGSDLVIGLNDISFLDSLDTNPTYIWHKKWYQHYIFFERDKIYPLLEQGLNNLLDGKAPFGEPAQTWQTKIVYFGSLSDDELAAGNDSMIERFGGCTLEDCKRNFADLDRLIEICRKKGIRLRAVWMPWNPKVPVYDFAKRIMDAANERFAQSGIDVFDMTNMIEPQYFYDIGHMSYENGAPYFTNVIDEFLCK